ncbi:hypothetical protein SAMN04487996_113149 [Dyadobacter soli]|uniref:Uncharacterized protein n=1 Tax=Dyadobacter soli TaxID=659014 RepID=A0A1G7PW71_9BACT|nr:hypothetical protein SAMN04487996_113149 [Dyadobacter soli]
MPRGIFDAAFDIICYQFYMPDGILVLKWIFSQQFIILVIDRLADRYGDPVIQSFPVPRRIIAPATRSLIHTFTHSLIQNSIIQNSLRKTSHVRRVRWPFAFVELCAAGGAVLHIHKRRFDAAADGRVHAVLPVGFHVNGRNARRE